MGPVARLLLPPLPNPRVVAREQDIRHLPAAVFRRPRVVRIFGRALEGDAVGLLDRALRIPEGTGSLRSTASQTTIAGSSPPAST